MEIDDSEFGKIRTATSPLQIDGHDKVAPLPAPRLGENNRELLTGLDLEPAEIDRLFADGVVK